jgi:hypothetical protein
MREDQARRLKRPIQPMPEFIHTALLTRGLLEAYQRRPAYQQNVRIGLWPAASRWALSPSG